MRQTHKSQKAHILWSNLVLHLSKAWSNSEIRFWVRCDIVTSCHRIHQTAFQLKSHRIQCLLRESERGGLQQQAKVMVFSNEISQGFSPGGWLPSFAPLSLPQRQRGQGQKPDEALGRHKSQQWANLPADNSRDDGSKYFPQVTKQQPGESRPTSGSFAW